MGQMEGGWGRNTWAALLNDTKAEGEKRYLGAPAICQNNTDAEFYIKPGGMTPLLGDSSAKLGSKLNKSRYFSSIPQTREEKKNYDVKIKWFDFWNN